MYSVLIVDDEVITCNSLAKIISNIRPHWNVETAYDGREAIEKFQNSHYDVLITDIKMPFIDGIDLIQQIKAVKPETICIIQSAFSDFEYAQNALKMGVTDYILKPISKIGVKELIDKIEGLIESLMLSNRKSISDIEKINFLIEYKAIPKNSNIMILLIEFEDENVSPDLVKLIRGLFPNNLCSINFFSTEPGKNAIVNLLNSCEETIDSESMIRAIEDILLCNRGLGCRFFVSEYLPYKEANITFAYSQAKTAKEFNFYFDKNDLSFSAIKDRYVSVLRLPENLENKFVTSFSFCEENNSNQLLDAIFTELTKDKLLYPSIVKEKFKYLFSNVLSNIRNLFWESKDSFLQELCAQIDGSLYIDDLKNALQSALNRISNVISDIDKNANGHIVQSSISYITSNLSSDLSLETVANKFSFSSNYFSKIFKDTTGMSYIEFLLQRRIEKAKQLLEKTNLKIYAVSLQVGYDNVGYFIRIFKKRTGLSPEEYRRLSK